MLGTYASAAFVCGSALLLGQAVLRLCGATRWSWLSAPVGLATMIAIAVPSLHVPGRATTAAVVLIGLVAAAVVWSLRTPAHRPPGRGLLAGLPVALLTAVPFGSAGYVGPLGWSFNNDMSAHLLLADAYRSELVERFNPLLPDYPLGPHALAGVMAQGLGVGVDEAFTGLTIASAVLLGWTALAAFRRPRPWAPFAATLVVGTPFLVAAYYGQGAFKELMETLFVLGFALLLAFPPQLGRLRRWIPAAVLLVGVLSVYSLPGLAWPLVFLGAWLAGALLRALLAGRSPRSIARDARDGLAPIAIGAGVLALAIVPQIPRLASFVANRTGGDGLVVAKDDIGNLLHPLPLWEAFGIWHSADFRAAAIDPVENGLWVALAVGLVVLGAAWAIRRGDWMLVVATGLTIVVWAVSKQSQSPYVAAKGLVILSPLLMLVAIRALGEDEGRDSAPPGWWRAAAPALAALLVVGVANASWNALRQSPVGPEDHLRQLRALQATLDHRPTLFLGNDDYIRWELGETPVSAPVIGFQTLPIRAQKPWSAGIAVDFDSLDSATLNRFDWAIAPRDASASAPPPQLKLVRTTSDFALYRRVATVPPTGVLAEGDGAAVALDCRSPRERALLRDGGVATVRGAAVSVGGPQLAPGASVNVTLALGAGRWDLVAAYTGPRPVQVAAPGVWRTLPPNLDRPGPHWPVGRIVVAEPGPVAVWFHALTGRWTAPTAITTIGSVTAVPVGTERTVPIAEACGALVDHYRDVAR